MSVRGRGGVGVAHLADTSHPGQDMLFRHASITTRLTEEEVNLVVVRVESVRYGKRRYKLALCWREGEEIPRGLAPAAGMFFQERI